MKVIQAIPSIPKPVTEQEVAKFLDSKLNMQLATIDSDGYPVIQPVWFLYDKNTGKIITGTDRRSRKIQNITRNPDKIYFSIDDESMPPKGVKGRGMAKLSEDIPKNVSVMEKLNMKYLGTLDHPLAARLMENVRNGSELMIEITPSFFSAWDFGKAM